MICCFLVALYSKLTEGDAVAQFLYDTLSEMGVVSFRFYLQSIIASESIGIS